jgi:hypothetical protein
MKYLVFTLLFVWISAAVSAQTVGDVVTKSDTSRNAYIKDFPQHYMYRMFFANRNFSFNLRSRVGEKRNIQYAPNGQNFVGFGFFYKKAGLELGIKLPVSDKLTTRYGNTKYIDLQTNYYGDKIGADLAIQRYRGFYVKNPYEVDTTWIPGKNYPQRGDITALNLGANVYYIFNNKKFSYRAAFAQTEQQTKSAGSFVLMGGASHLRFRGKNSFIPLSELAAFGENTNFRQGNFYSLAILPGYAHTFIVDEFYLSLSFHMGVGVQHKHYIINERVYDDLNISRKNNMRIAGGYYGKQFLGGLSVIIDNTPIQMQNVVLSASSYSVKIFIGHRFNSKKLDKQMERLKIRVKSYKTKYLKK